MPATVDKFSQAYFIFFCNRVETIGDLPNENYKINGCSLVYHFVGHCMKIGKPQCLRYPLYQSDIFCSFTKLIYI